MIDRRECLAGWAALAGGLALPFRADAAAKPLTFGVCADVHQDIMHDGPQRLKTFIDDMNRRRVEFVIQLGDFCVPHPRNADFMKVWRRFRGPRYHVLGNHDTDGGYTQQQTMKFWGMAKRYHSFDRGGFHFVVLDGNEGHRGRAPGYPRYVGGDQLKWLAADLAATTRPTLIFSHQSLEHPQGVENGAEARAVIAAAAKNPRHADVVACLSGHHHIDAVVPVAGVPYVQVNSMSYYWLGGKYARARYGPAVEKKHPTIKYTAPYADPLYAAVTLDPAKGVMTVEGRASRFVGPTPWALGVAETAENNKRTVVPRVSGRRLTW